MWINLPEAFAQMANFLNFGKTYVIEGWGTVHPIVPIGEARVKVNDLMSCTRGRKINDCLHIKPLTFDGDKPFYGAVIYHGEWYLPDGEVFNSSRNTWTSWHTGGTWNYKGDEYRLFFAFVQGLPSHRWHFDKYQCKGGSLSCAIWAVARESSTRVKYLFGDTTNVGFDYRTGWSVRRGSGQSTIISTDTSFSEIDFPSKRELSDALYEKLRSMASGWINEHNFVSEIINHQALTPLSGAYYIPKPSFKSCIFNENLLYEGYDDLQLSGGASYWKNWLIQHAYLEALRSTPTMSDNNIANVLEIASFLRGIIVNHKIEIPRSWQSAWLAYRYSYGTTRSDIEDAVKFSHRMCDIGDLSKGIKCYGTSFHNVNGIDVTCRCSLTLKPKVINSLANVVRELDTYGLSPTLHRLWDLIPYSFVVDWFIPVDDVISVADAEKKYRDWYDISNVCFSISYTNRSAHDLYSYRVYYRWASAPLKSLNEFYWLDKAGPSGKVRNMRIADAVSLITS